MLILKAEMERDLGITADVGPVQNHPHHDKGMDD